MGQGKVPSKYYSPDFDHTPSFVRFRRPKKNKLIKVRFMLPVSVRCNAGGNFMDKGTKFNAPKEQVVGETYLGIQVLRFYFKCTKCCAKLTMKTDPQNSDYIVESGASRNCGNAGRDGVLGPWRTQLWILKEK